MEGPVNNVTLALFSGLASAVLGAIILLWQLRVQSRQLGAQGVMSFLRELYSDRSFRATPAPSPKGVPIEKLRDAKREFKAQIRDAVRWMEQCCKDGTDENRIAFETAQALQDLGQA